MNDYDELVRKAGMERSAYVGELIARGIIAITRFFSRKEPASQAPLNVWKKA